MTNATDGPGAEAKPTRLGDQAYLKASVPGTHCPRIKRWLSPVRYCRSPGSLKVRTGWTVPHVNAPPRRPAAADGLTR